jgi:hypothetical protein
MDDVSTACVPVISDYQSLISGYQLKVSEIAEKKPEEPPAH